VWGGDVCLCVSVCLPNPLCCSLWSAVTWRRTRRTGGRLFADKSCTLDLARSAKQYAKGLPSVLRFLKIYGRAVFGQGYFCPKFSRSLKKGADEFDLGNRMGEWEFGDGVGQGRGAGSREMMEKGRRSGAGGEQSGSSGLCIAPHLIGLEYPDCLPRDPPGIQHLSVCSPHAPAHLPPPPY
jgi:hypothetical protein